MPKIEDLAGKKFNKLLVVSYAGKVGNDRTWNCICDCGNKTTATTHRLTSGRKKSCGCLLDKQYDDLTGYENEHLLVLSKAEDKEYSNGLKMVQWNCKCKQCGKFFRVTAQNIKQRKVKSCGCYTFELKGRTHRKHGMFGTRIYLSWAHMVSRCYNKNVDTYPRYGGRGITICQEWLGEHGFENFFEWSMKNGYAENLTIDRIDNDKGYSPDNCRWATDTEQVRNRRNTLLVEVDGVSKPLAEWCEIYKIDYKLAYGRIFRRKWDVKKALTTKKYDRR